VKLEIHSLKLSELTFALCENRWSCQQYFNR